jgi:hypothetical protein
MGANANTITEIDGEAPSSASASGDASRGKTQVTPPAAEKILSTLKHFQLFRPFLLNTSSWHRCTLFTNSLLDIILRHFTFVRQSASKSATHRKITPPQRTRNADADPWHWRKIHNSTNRHVVVSKKTTPARILRHPHRRSANR